MHTYIAFDIGYHLERLKEDQQYLSERSKDTFYRLLEQYTPVRSYLANTEELRDNQIPSQEMIERIQWLSPLVGILRAEVEDAKFFSNLESQGLIEEYTAILEKRVRGLEGKIASLDHQLANASYKLNPDILPKRLQEIHGMVAELSWRRQDGARYIQLYDQIRGLLGSSERNIQWAEATYLKETTNIILGSL